MHHYNHRLAMTPTTLAKVCFGNYHLLVTSWMCVSRCRLHPKIRLVHLTTHFLTYTEVDDERLVHFGLRATGAKDATLRAAWQSSQQLGHLQIGGAAGFAMYGGVAGALLPMPLGRP